jgi:hypothetical protein
MGYRVGQRVLELIVWREKNSRRETRILGILQFIHTTVWKTLFGKAADALEKSRESDDECPAPTFPISIRILQLPPLPLLSFLSAPIRIFSSSFRFCGTDRGRGI